MRHLPEIRIQIIPHKSQRYDTCGDYYKNGSEWQFDISRMNTDYEFLVLIHEMIEWFLTQKRGIKEKDITKFDKMFEEERRLGKWTTEEPGHDPRAPYKKEHEIAEKIEKLLAIELGVDWGTYDKAVISL